MENKIKVLLADNSEHFGIPCANVMRSHGLDVETVEKDGRQLLGSIERGHPDVVIMDFFLPRLDAIGVDQKRTNHRGFQASVYGDVQL